MLWAVFLESLPLNSQESIQMCNYQLWQNFVFSGERGEGLGPSDWQWHSSPNPGVVEMLSQEKPFVSNDI